MGSANVRHFDFFTLLRLSITQELLENFVLFSKHIGTVIRKFELNFESTSVQGLSEKTLATKIAIESVIISQIYYKIQQMKA